MAYDIAKMLQNVTSVNNFDTVSGVKLYDGNDTATITFQLWQTDMDMRYVPTAGATLSVRFPRSLTVDANSPTNQDVTISATNPYATDTSIWQVTLNAAQISTVCGGGMELTLTESGNDYIIFVPQVIEKVAQISV